MSKPFVFAVLSFWAGVTTAQPVSEPNGRVTGTVGGAKIDLPVRCEGSPVAHARSHDERATPSVVLGIPTGPSRFGLVDVRTEASQIYVGAAPSNKGFPTTFAGEADGVSFELVLDCQTAE